MERHNGDDLNPLLAEVRGCTRCELPLGPRPVLQIAPRAPILIAGQAPCGRQKINVFPDYAGLCRMRVAGGAWNQGVAGCRRRWVGRTGAARNNDESECSQGGFGL